VNVKRPLGSLAEWPLIWTAGEIRFGSSCEQQTKPPLAKPRIRAA
jgi:hypothetical protein